MSAPDFESRLRENELRKNLFSYVSGGIESPLFITNNVYKEQTGKEWVKQLNFNSDEIILIGDTLHDKEVADIIGADCALVGTGHVSSKRLKEAGSPVFNNLIETLDWISN